MLHCVRSKPCLLQALLGTFFLWNSDPSLAEGPDDLRFNQIQVIGTHNSYHLRPDSASLDLAVAMNEGAKSWDYSHCPLNEQLDHGVRSFELDVYWREEQFKVFHLPVIDFRSSCETLRDCLTTVRDWSDAHPKHVPISFLLELKDQSRPGGEKDQILNGALLEGLDQVILSVFPLPRLLRPDDIRSDLSTLEEAVKTLGWPRLRDCRGKAMIVLHVRDRVRSVYTQLHPGLQGAACFVRSPPGRPEAAVVVHDHPSVESIQSLVRAGYLVRTRADANLNLRASKNGPAQRRDDALRSGAHIISTDFPPGEPHKETGYVCQFPHGFPVRPNPVLVSEERLHWVVE